MKIKTSDLIGPALDWAVSKCEGRDYHSYECTYATDGSGKVWAAGTCPSEDRYSTRWSQGGPLIEREGIQLVVNRNVGTTESGVEFDERDGWKAYRTGRYWQPKPTYFGPTPLIAAMRCFVASKLGDEVEVPDELLET